MRKENYAGGARTVSAVTLQARLSDTIDLALQLKHALWRVRSLSPPDFSNRLDGLPSRIFSYADRIADRLIECGSSADMRIQTVAETSSLHEYPVGPETWTDHGGAITAVMLEFGTMLQDDVERFDEQLDFQAIELFNFIRSDLDIHRVALELAIAVPR